MAYMSQENKKRIVALCKPILANYKVKATFSVPYGNHGIVVKIKTGTLFTEKVYVNHYYISDTFSGDRKKFLLELKKAMMDGNWDNSDTQTDYFDVGWYIKILITD